MDELSRQNDELAAKFKEKLFFFDDIPLLSDRALQCLLREIDENLLTKALKAATKPICEKFFRNMSEKVLSKVYFYATILLIYFEKDSFKYERTESWVAFCYAKNRLFALR